MSSSASSLIAQPPLPWRRGAWALAVSLLLHLLIADFGFGGRATQAVRPASSLQAELVAMPPQSTVDTPSVAVVVPASSSPLRDWTPSSFQPAKEGSAASDSVQASSGITDRHIYQARELDRYPQPLAPLSVRRPPGSGPLRLWLTIDTRGQVVELASASGQPVEAALQEQLLAVVFSPALRDQQAVKSRILLELDD